MTFVIPWKSLWSTTLPRDCILSYQLIYPVEILFGWSLYTNVSMERHTFLLLRLLEPGPNIWSPQCSVATSTVGNWKPGWPDCDQTASEGPESKFFAHLLPPLSLVHMV